MKMNSVQRHLAPNGFWVNLFLPSANRRLQDHSVNCDEEEQLSYWQLVFSQSRANSCVYEFAVLPHAHWLWPKNTWFQERLSNSLTALGTSRDKTGVR